MNVAHRDLKPENVKPTGENCGQCPSLVESSRYRPSQCLAFGGRPERYWRGRKGHLRLLDCYAHEKAQGSSLGVAS